MLDLGDKDSSVAFLRAPQVQTLARCAIASTSPVDGGKVSGGFDLKCSAYQLKGAMLGFGAAGSIYKVSCRYLTGPDREGLEKAAESKAAVRLVFPDGSIVLADVKVQRPGDGWTSIEGRLVATYTKGDR